MSVIQLAITISQASDIDAYRKHADIFIVGLAPFCPRMEKAFCLAELETMVKDINASGKAAWINASAIIHEGAIDAWRDACQALSRLDVDGVLFADPAVFSYGADTLRKQLIYHVPILSNSADDAAFWQHENIAGVTLGNELSLAEIHDIACAKTSLFALIGHGFIPMMHSRRPLIDAHYQTRQRAPDDGVNRLFVREEVRQETYPVLEDAHGTHLFRAKPLSSFHALHALSAHIDVFIIDTLFMSVKNAADVLADYRTALTRGDARPFIEKYDDHDQGFYHGLPSSKGDESHD